MRFEGWALLAVLGGLPALAGCARARSLPESSQCTQCHGDETRNSAVALNDAAPPVGVAGGTQPTDPDVGAHLAHLQGREFSSGVACRECHAPPGADHPDGEVQLDFGAPGNVAPETIYDPGTRTCSSCSCHGANVTPPWNVDPATSPIVCGSCHALPPTTGSHPSVGSDLTGCVACHAETVDASGGILAGGRHVNGAADYFGGHPAGWGDPTSPAFHGADALAFLEQQAGAANCASCHGADLDGAGAAPSCTGCHASTPSALFPGGVSSWKTNCTFCHGSPTEPFDYASQLGKAAPPDDVSGRLTGTNTPSRVGAHQVHLTGSAIANAFACATCHPVPIQATSLDHLIGGAVEVALSGAGQAALPASLGTYTAASHTCAVYCHDPPSAFGSNVGGAAPAWDGSGYECNACHGNASSSQSPNYPNTGRHDDHVRSRHVGCANCHNTVVTDVAWSTTPSIANKPLHVNGAEDVVFGGTFETEPVTGTWNPAPASGQRNCTVSCHGSRDW